MRLCKWLPVTLVAVFLFACASYRESLQPSERVVLGLLLESTDGTYWGQVGSALVEQARTAGFEVLVRPAGGREPGDLQRPVREMVRAGASLLVYMPGAGSYSDPVLVRGDLSPVPVIAGGGLIPGWQPSLYVGSDPEAAGYLQVRTVRGRIPGGGMVLLGGPEGDSVAAGLREGQLTALAEWEESRDDSAGFLVDLRLDLPSAAEAARVLRELLADPAREPGQVAAVLAFDDEVAAGVIDVLQEKGIAGKAAVAGRGASLAACRRIISGDQLLTVYLSPEDLASATVRSAIRLARGMVPGEVAQSLGREPRQMESGTGPVPAVLIDPVPVTRSTMIETVIIDGLYPIEAVYGTLEPEKTVH